MIGFQKAMIQPCIPAAILFCLTLFIGTNLFAQQTQPCADDVAKLCNGVQQGGGRIAKCLSQHKNELSDACTARIAETRKKAKEVTEACADDVAKFCNGVQQGGGRIAKCIRRHQSELSSECQEAIGRARRR